MSVEHIQYQCVKCSATTNYELCGNCEVKISYIVVQQDSRVYFFKDGSSVKAYFQVGTRSNSQKVENKDNLFEGKPKKTLPKVE